MLSHFALISCPSPNWPDISRIAMAGDNEVTTDMNGQRDLAALGSEVWEQLVSHETRYIPTLQKQKKFHAPLSIREDGGCGERCIRSVRRRVSRRGLEAKNFRTERGVHLSVSDSLKQPF